jgi:hypothetical protein
MLARDGFWCYLCEQDVAPDEVCFHYVIPLEDGGVHGEGNMRVTHEACSDRAREQHRALSAFR